MNTLFLEDFILDPFCEFEIKDYTEQVRDWIYEAAEGATKKNIFQRMLDLMKKLFGFIANLIKKFVNYIKSIFIKNKKKPVDQILEENDILPKANTSSNNAPSNDTPSKDSNLKATSVPVQVKQPDGSIKTEEYKALARNIKINIEGDKIKLVLNKDNGNWEVRDTDHINSNKKIMFKLSPYVATLLMYFFECEEIKKAYDSYLEVLPKYLNDLTNVDLRNEYLRAASKLPKEMYDINKFYLGINNNATLTFDMSEFDRVSDVIGSIFDKIGSIQNTITANNPNNQSTDNIPKNVISDLNKILNSLRHASYGMNTLLLNLKDPDTLSSEYIGVLKDADSIDKVVKIFIDNKVPPLHINYNITMMTDPKLRKVVDVVNGKEYGKSGQTRVALIPDGEKDVIKFAINNAGINANTNEIRAWKILTTKGGKGGNYFIPIKEYGKNNCVVIQPYIECYKVNNGVIETESSVVANKIINIVSSKAFSDKYGFTPKDIHELNVSKSLINGNHVIVDYGDIIWA